MLHCNALFYSLLSRECGLCQLGQVTRVAPFTIFQLEQSSFPWQRKEIYYFPIKTIKFSLATKDLSGVE